jgi:drug/metabolite transporter (DMT)-like permease
MLFDWVSTAILGAAILGIVNIIDSHLLSKRMPGLRAFLLLVAVFHFVYACVLFFLFPLSEDTGTMPVLIAICSGLARTSAVTIMLYSLRKSEVAKIIPVVYSYPIFVAIMAVPILGEHISYLDWVAILTVVAGAVIVSAQESPGGSSAMNIKSLLFLFLSSLLFAASDIASKYALGFMSFWNISWISAFCMSGIFLLTSLRPGIIREVSAIKARFSTLALLACNETLAVMGIVMQLWAMQRGPVSLVSTIISSRPVFVVLFAYLLSRLLPGFINWQAGRGMLVLRLVAVSMIVGGIAIIYLT